MSVQTSYDDMRDELREELNKCLKLAKELVVGEDIWGYNDMREDYAMNVYLKIKETRNMV